jgi:hypothetical protein
MAVAPGTALSGIVLSATVRPRNASAVGVSLLLLVSVRLGGLDFCAAWDRVLQTENLTDKSEAAAGFNHVAEPPLLKENNAPAGFWRVALTVILRLSGVCDDLPYDWPLGDGVEAVVG